MSRQLKFRGKRVDNGEWVYGWVFGDKAKSIIEIDKEYPNEYGVEAYYTSVVIPETVGQHTGLKDKNGAGIYEGDILQWSVDADQAGEKPLSDTYTVIYRNGGFYLENHKDVYPKDEPISEVVRYYGEYQVIGSIYDNPELMEDTK